MATVKASQANLAFPVVVFSRSEGLLHYEDFQTLSVCPPVYVKERTLIGMKLIDNDREQWIIRALHLEEPIVEPKWWQIFRSTPLARFDLDLEPKGSIDLEGLRRRYLRAAELEFPEHKRAVREAPDLATMLEASYSQGSGLL